MRLPIAVRMAAPSANSMVSMPEPCSTKDTKWRMLDSSSTTKQSGAEEGASGGEGTSDTAGADFGSGNAAVLAMTITYE